MALVRSLVRTAVITSSFTSVYGGYYANRLANQSSPSYTNLTRGERAAETFRTMWITGSGVFLGSSVLLWGPPTYLLVNV